MANEPVIPTSLGSTVVGNTDSYKELDKKIKVILQNKSVTELSPEEFEKVVECLKQNPLTGCTSVLNMARVSSGYNPDDPLGPDSNRKFNDYIARVLKAPFFNLVMSETTNYNRQDTSWNSAVDVIVKMFDGVEEKDRSQIKSTIVNMTEAAASRMNTANKTNLSAVNSIFADDQKNNILTYIYTSSVEVIESHAGGKHGWDSKQTKLDIVRIKLDFDCGIWSTFAKKVAERSIKLVDDWLDDNNTKPLPGANKKLCISQ
jgi:hypothetical protein